MEHMASQFYLPNKAASQEAYQSIFGLSQLEANFVTAMRREQRQMLLKRGGEAAILLSFIGRPESARPTP